jgi:hypothetical protein
MLHRNRLVAALTLALTASHLVVACGDGLDNVVEEPGGRANGGTTSVAGTSGTGGKAGSPGTAGSSTSDAGDTSDGGDGGTSSGGAAGSGGTAGQAGNAGFGGATAGSAGSAGHAGASGTAGSGGTGGGGGTAGSGGSAGAAGSSGSAGSGGSGGSSGSAGSGGSGGSSGGGSGPTCGNNAVDAGELCDPPFSANNCGSLHSGSKPDATLGCTNIETGVCVACLMTVDGLDAFDCADETGNALGGPAVGQSRKALCYKLLDCMYDTDCAATDSLDCYCGLAGQACQTGGGTGLCRAELEAALETTAFAEIGARIGDPAWAGGVAVVRVDAGREMCGATCGTCQTCGTP